MINKSSYGHGTYHNAQYLKANIKILGLQVINIDNKRDSNSYFLTYLSNMLAPNASAATKETLVRHGKGLKRGRLQLLQNSDHNCDVKAQKVKPGQ